MSTDGSPPIQRPAAIVVASSSVAQVRTRIACSLSSAARTVLWCVSGTLRIHPHLGWILSVPDTHQRTVLAALDKERAIRVLTCATEDEAVAIAAGLYIGGEPVALMIQHAGLYASVNTLRGVALDGRLPIFYMIGLLGREKDRDRATPGTRWCATASRCWTSSGSPTRGSRARAT